MMSLKTLALALVLGASAAAYAQPDNPNTESVVDNAAGMDKTQSAKNEGHADDAHEGLGEPDPSKHFNYFNFSYRGKDEYGGAYGDGVETTPDGQVLHEEEPMSPPFVFMLANFAILLWILVKYGAPFMKKTAEERHDLIKNAIDEATKLRDEAQAKLAEYEARVKGLDDEIKKLVDGIRADAESDKARILEQAQAQAAQLQREAEQRIAAEIELARTQLTKEVTAAAAAATEKLLKDKVTMDDQRGLVTTFIKSVETQRSAS